MVRTIWNMIMNFIRGVGDDVLGRWIGDFIFNRSTGESATPAAGTPANSEEAKRGNRAVLIIWSGKLNPTAQQNLLAIWMKPEFRPYRDKFERGLDDMLDELEQKQGIFPRVVESTTTENGAGDKKEKKTTQRLEPQTGWGPADLLIPALNNAGKDPQSVKAFIESVTRTTIFDRLANGELGDFKTAAKKTAGVATVVILVLIFLWVYGIYWFASDAKEDLTIAAKHLVGNMDKFAWGMVKAGIALIMLFGPFYNRFKKEVSK